MDQIERQLDAIIDRHRDLRRAALARILDAITATGTASGDHLKPDRDYLDTWRITQKSDIDAILAQHRTNPTAVDAPNFHDLDSVHTDIATPLLDLAIRWHQANHNRLSRLTLDQLATHHLAARTIATIPDLLSQFDALDDADVTVALLAAAGATSLNAPHYNTVDADQMITDALDLPRPTGPLLARPDQDATDDGIMTPTTHPGSTTSATPLSQQFIDWAHRAIDAIERSIHTYLAAHRWDIRGMHMGAVIQEYNDHAIPALLGDPHAIAYTLTPDTAVAIAMLRGGTVIDHTDRLDNATAWYEAMVLWCDDNNTAEIPPHDIARLAELYQIPLLDISATPTDPTE